MKTCADCEMPCDGVRCIDCHRRFRRRNIHRKFCPDCGKQIREVSTHCRPHSYQHRRDDPTPTTELWIATASEEAGRVKAKPAAVISGDRNLRPLIARSRAWCRLLENGYSLAGIGRASGFHHTTIMNVRDRLQVFERRLAAQECGP